MVMSDRGPLRTFDTLTQEEHDKFSRLQDKLVPAPILILPLRRGHIAPETDAYNRQDWVPGSKIDRMEQECHVATSQRRPMQENKATIQQIESGCL